MFKVSVLCLAALCSLHSTTDAVITGWSTPLIGTKDGSGALTAKVAEDLSPGTTTITLVATFNDGSGSVAYAMLSQPSTNKLTIAAGGLLSLAASKSFDFETEPTYVFTVTATIGASVGTATVTLSITNVNEAPVFASSQYAATIPDGSTAGTTLTTVKATDPDAGNTVTYGLEATSNVGSVFAISTSTGIITVAATKTTDAATDRGYKLLVTAADSASLTVTSTVWVAVKTCSSNSAALIASVVTMLVALVASLQ